MLFASSVQGATAGGSSQERYSLSVKDTIFKFTLQIRRLFLLVTGLPSSYLSAASVVLLDIFRRMQLEPVVVLSNDGKVIFFGVHDDETPSGSEEGVVGIHNLPNHTDTLCWVRGGQRYGTCGVVQMCFSWPALSNWMISSVVEGSCTTQRASLYDCNFSRTPTLDACMLSVGRKQRTGYSRRDVRWIRPLPSRTA